MTEKNMGGSGPTKFIAKTLRTKIVFGRQSARVVFYTKLTSFMRKQKEQSVNICSLYMWDTFIV